MIRHHAHSMLAIVLTSFVLVISAQARWKPEYANASPAIQTWYSAQHNAQGQWCCDRSDGHAFFGGYSVNSDGSVTLDTEKGPHRIPSYMVLNTPNPTGHAVWWFLDRSDGTHIDYCFAPGSMS